MLDSIWGKANACRRGKAAGDFCKLPAGRDRQHFRGMEASAGGFCRRSPFVPPWSGL
jgi:hypothetical protein